MFVLGLGLVATGLAAQGATLTLCSAKKDGIYHFAAEHIGQAARGPELEVKVVETHGSFDNLMRMTRGECDAAIVQFDALMVYSMERVKGRLKITVPVHLYDEWLHLVCRRASGIEDVGDLLHSTEPSTILTGGPGSGSETTWRALTDLDEDYEAVVDRAIGRQAALEALLSGESGDCMVVVVGAGAPFMDELDERGESLRLASVDLFEFRDAELVDNRVYKSTVIPGGTYRNLQAGLDNPEIETIAVEATLVVSKAWARAHPKPYKTFMRAVSAAKPAIRARLKQ